CVNPVVPGNDDSTTDGNGAPFTRGREWPWATGTAGNGERDTGRRPTLVSSAARGPGRAREVRPVLAVLRECEAAFTGQPRAFRLPFSLSRSERVRQDRQADHQQPEHRLGNHAEHEAQQAA